MKYDAADNSRKCYEQAIGLMRNKEEEKLHLQVAEYLDLALPDSALWWHTHQTNNVPVQFRVKMKRLGVKAGMPDIMILWRGKLICIELKKPGGTVSKAQREMHMRLTLAGAVVSVQDSLDKVTAFLDMIGIPIKARVAA